MIACQTMRVQNRRLILIRTAGPGRCRGGGCGLASCVMLRRYKQRTTGDSTGWGRLGALRACLPLPSPPPRCDLADDDLPRPPRGTQIARVDRACVTDRRFPAPRFFFRCVIDGSVPVTRAEGDGARAR